MKILAILAVLFFSIFSSSIAASGGRTCVIPAAGDGSDDSPAIREAFRECGNGGHIVFQEDKTYSIETMLQLHNLSSVQVDILGTIMFSTDVRYWIRHGSYFWFQNISIALEFSGDHITIDGHDRGIIDGQGQVWYDLALGIGGLYGRPIPFALRNAQNSVAKNFWIKQSGKWNFVIVESKNITVDNIRITSLSDDFQANPGNLGNTDGFDTLFSDNVRIMNSYIDSGDDCVSFKPAGSTNIHVQNLTCVNTAGIAIGSLGQYEGQFDLVENITATDITLIGSRNGAYIKTYNGKSVYYPPQGGGNGTGLVRNVLFKNFNIQNITASPVLIQQCTHWAGWDVPPCAEFPANGFTFSNITWTNFTGYSNPTVGTTEVSLVCSPKSKCTGLSFEAINVKPANGSATYSCTNVDGLDSSCKAS
ncbi:glycoside hydrolase family 28 protein [Rhizodiscina lignyota]|uniref:galacturonan 1,4-alpha-galacturonidase n=1 Tax=Rhizodiscina lignyota TaxID=1504668 RepID=A0A9P4ILR1_9PEZI|nr:glycoside hydrolase family 28 protein [Rhizodiscina lignyota]